MSIMQHDEHWVQPATRRFMAKKLAEHFGDSPDCHELSEILQETIGHRAHVCGVSLREFFDDESFEWKAQTVEEKIATLQRLKERGLPLMRLVYIHCLDRNRKGSRYMLGA